LYFKTFMKCWQNWGHYLLMLFGHHNSLSAAWMALLVEQQHLMAKFSGP